MRKKFYLPAVAAAAIAVFASVAVVSAKSDSGADNTIADRVYIGEIHVGGMTQEEATEAVSEYVDSLEDKEIHAESGRPEHYGNSRGTGAGMERYGCGSDCPGLRENRKSDCQI